MKITHIESSNIKSFKDLSVDLTDFNVIIGMNGAGKSNFILLFKLIKDILSTSLQQAINNQGGTELLKNFYMQSGVDTLKLNYSLQLVSELSTIKKISGRDVVLQIKSMTSSLEIMLDNATNNLRLVNDKLEIKFEYFSSNIKSGSSALIAIRSGNKYQIQLQNYDSVDYEIREVFGDVAAIMDANYGDDEIILHHLFKEFFNIDLNNSAARHISIYEFEQDLLSNIKANTAINDETESRDLFMDLLHNVLNDEAKKRSFFNLLNFVLPDIDDVIMEKGTQNEHRFLVKERFNKRYLPAYLLSDGTVFLIVIILALYFDNKYLTIFDEPERRIHPHLISKVIDMMKDVSTHKQIILSTHNSEIVKYSGLDSIVLIKRDDEGHSQLIRPKNSREIATFLDNEIGLDELFVQNMLS